MAIYEIAATTTTTATPAQVWAVLDDFSSWPDWMPSMRNLRVELHSPGQPRSGYRFRLRGILAYADLEVTGYTELERVTYFRMNIPPLTGVNSCIITPLSDGIYQIDRIDQINLFNPLVSILNTQRSYFEELAAEFLAALKQTVEQRVNHAVS